MTRTVTETQVGASHIDGLASIAHRSIKKLSGNLWPNKCNCVHTEIQHPGFQQVEFRRICQWGLVDDRNERRRVLWKIKKLVYAAY